MADSHTANQKTASIKTAEIDLIYVLVLHIWGIVHSVTNRIEIQRRPGNKTVAEGRTKKVV